jgi:hypothetical protein
MEWKIEKNRKEYARERERERSGMNNVCADFDSEKKE